LFHIVTTKEIRPKTMAEKNDNWFSWIAAAKNKSVEVLEFVKKDLEEFGSAVKNEATQAVASAGSAVERTLKLDEPDSTASSMKRSISSFIGQMNEVLNPIPDDSDTEAILIVDGQETVTLSKLQQAVYNLQKDENTFLTDPDSSLQKQYECWLEILDENLSDERLAKHLQSSVTLNTQYMNLVPDKVSTELFWKRYLFKKALIEDNIAREEILEKRKETKPEAEKWTDNNVEWEQEEFPKEVELSEEEQIKLLQQYEEERKAEKRLSKENIGEKVVFQQESKSGKKINKR